MAINLAALPLKNLRITSSFGSRPGIGYDNFHSGVDLGAISPGLAGDPVYAVNVGVVKVANYSSSYGNYVVIEHNTIGGTFCSLYAHLLSYNVDLEQKVMAGQNIGAMGKSGGTNAVHLHFELRNIPYLRWSGSRGNVNNTKCVDPAPYLNAVGNSVFLPNYIANQQSQEVTYERVILDQNNVTTRNKLYGRKWRVMVFDESGSGIDISDLHCIFIVSKVMGGYGTISQVLVYNLNSKTEGFFIEKANRLTIEAGYENLFGLIFDGDVIQCTREKQNGTDFVLKFICKDGAAFANEGFVSVSLNGSSLQTKRDVINAIIENSTISTNLGSVSSSYNEGKYIRGKVMFGRANDYLHQIIKSNEGMMYNDNGEVNLITMDDLPESEIIKLDSKSGLIGTPQQNETGIEFQALINPRIKLNTLVNIDNRQIVAQEYSTSNIQSNLLDKDGVYRVIEMDISGDNRGTDWYINAKAVSQAGNIPTIIAGVI